MDSWACNVWFKLSLIVLWLGGGITGCVVEPSPSYDLAITNVTVIDAGEGSRANRTVLIRGDKIVGTMGAPTPGAAVGYTAGTMIDGTGQFLLPGLWDMHVHVTYEPELTDRMADLFLDYGITSVRDTGGLLHELVPVVEQWRTPTKIAPNIYFSGPLLDGSLVVYDGNGRSEIGVANPTTAAATQNIKRLVAAGVDFIKIYELVSPEVFAALVAAARKENLPIAAHVPLSLSALSAGPEVGSMEHLRNIELACASNAQELHQERVRTIQAANEAQGSGYLLRSGLHSEQRPQALANVDLQSSQCQSVIKALRGTIQVPTLRLNTLVANFPMERADWSQAMAAVPEELMQRWLATSAAVAAGDTQLAQASGDWSVVLVAALHEAGVPIGAGTDTPIGVSIPGYSLHTELERLVEAGLQPIDAIAAATLRPAEFFKATDTIGLVAPNYTADLVLLDKNPLLDIKHTRSISKVILGGRVVRD